MPKQTGVSPATIRFSDIACSDLGAHLTFSKMQAMKKNPLATAELRFSYNPTPYPGAITSQQDATAYLRSIWDNDLLNIQEQVYVLFLNTAHEVICWRCLHTGGINNCTLDLKLLFGLACGCLASSIVVAHNHPSGSLRPSVNDVKLTRQLKDAGKLMGVNLIDHFIIGQVGSYSLVHGVVVDEAGLRF